MGLPGSGSGPEEGPPALTCASHRRTAAVHCCWTCAVRCLSVLWPAVPRGPPHLASHKAFTLTSGFTCTPTPCPLPRSASRSTELTAATHPRPFCCPSSPAFCSWPFSPPSSPPRFSESHLSGCSPRRPPPEPYTHLSILTITSRSTSRAACTGEM